MLVFISIGILIANFAKNTRVVSTIGNTLFPANSWPKEVKQVVKYFSMNNLWDALRQTVIYNTQNMHHCIFQTICLVTCLLVIEA